jgi:hypothetical protein
MQINAALDSSPVIRLNVPGPSVGRRSPRGDVANNQGLID